MIVRQAKERDRADILEIYARARAFMKEAGNPTQWGTDWPPAALIDEDLRLGRNYVVEDQGETVGVFMVLFGEDIEPTYRKIDGAWKKEGPYAVIHRIAVRDHGKGIGAFALNWVFEQSGHVRIDTHAENRPMRSLLARLGYEYCGVITVRDGSLRDAYEKY